MKVIGIVGGVGPYAGLEFNKKIFNATQARSDQEYPEVVLISASGKIGDRTEYLLNPTQLPNPAEAIFQVIQLLEKAGADFVSIPCNTAHSSPIMNVIRENIKKYGLQIKLVHMLEETFNYLKTQCLNIRRVGLLATKGTHTSKVFDTMASEFGINLIIPKPNDIDIVHSSIYHPEYGIKSKSNPITDQAVTILKSNAESLISKGAEAVIMGCTEIPLALAGVTLSVPLLDPMDITAQALVKLAQS